MYKSIFASKSTIILSILILGLMTTLIIEASQPPLPILGKVNNLDKVAHFSAYSCLSILICALYLKISTKERIPLFSAPLLITSVYGLIEEIYQSFVPSRSASVYDLLADISGAIFAIFIANIISKFIHKQNNNNTRIGRYLSVFIK